MIRALVLDKSHRIFMPQGNTQELLFHHFPSLEDAKRELKAEGYAVDAPVGVAPPDFVFLSPEDHGQGDTANWTSLAKAAKNYPNEPYWDTYTKLMLGGYEPPSREVDVFHFASDPLMATKLAHLVMKGDKRSTSGNPEAMEKFGIALPYVGLISIVTDGFGIPLCCIETERVEMHPFKEVSAELAAAEGEGDRTLEDWRLSHWEYFTKEAARTGLHFDENTVVGNEWFRLLKVFGS